VKKFWSVIFSLVALGTIILSWVYAGLAIFQANIADAKVAFVSLIVAIVTASITKSLA
jgi:hypothetical protein